MLERIGLLTEVDLAALANYCSLYSTIVQCERVLREQGYTVELREPSTTDAAGNAVPGAVRYVQQRPEVAIRHKAILGIRAYLTEFGMTPSSRGRMNVLPIQEDDEDDPFD